MGPPLKAAENALWRRSVAIEYDLQWAAAKSSGKFVDVVAK